MSNNNTYAQGNLSYRIPTKRFIQGWDFTLRREAYTWIPDDFKMFGGDDHLFLNLYSKGWKVAVALSSPIIHYGKASWKYYKGDRAEGVPLYAKYNYKRIRYGATLK